jgi:hypothetical protein
MLALVVAFSLVIGFVVAAGMIGRESRRLSLQPRQPVWRLEEAAVFVEAELPFDAAAKIDGETLRELLRVHLNQLQFKADPGDVDDIAEESTAIQHVYREALSQGIEITRPTIDAVVRAHFRYLNAIGALGAASSPE